MKLHRTFEKQPLWLKIILLVIPFVGWITELVVRWSAAIEEKSALNLVLAILFTLGIGLVWCYVDLVFEIITGHVAFAK